MIARAEKTVGVCFGTIFPPQLQPNPGRIEVNPPAADGLRNEAGLRRMQGGTEAHRRRRTLHDHFPAVVIAGLFEERALEGVHLSRGVRHSFNRTLVACESPSQINSDVTGGLQSKSRYAVGQAAQHLRNCSSEIGTDLMESLNHQSALSTDPPLERGALDRPMLFGGLGPVVSERPSNPSYGCADALPPCGKEAGLHRSA